MLISVCVELGSQSQQLGVHSGLIGLRIGVFQYSKLSPKALRMGPKLEVGVSRLLNISNFENVLALSCNACQFRNG